MRRSAGCGAVATVAILMLGGAVADEPRREAGQAGGERRAEQPVARGERTPAGREGGHNGGFPAEITLTEEQQKKIADLRVTFGPALAELDRKRAAILTDEQKQARLEAEQRIRTEALGRQEAAALLESAVKPSAEQKAAFDAVEQETRKVRSEAEVQRLAVLTEEQRQVLRGIERSRRTERMFQMPPEIKLDDAQRAGLKAVQDELGNEVVALEEKKEKLLTPERIAAREKVMQAVREGSMDRQAAAAALESAMALTDAEKAELMSAEASLQDLRQKIQDRVLALLTPEQRQELEKKFGVGRGRQ